VLQNDNDIVRGLGFVALYSAYLEEQIDNLLFMLSEVDDLLANLDVAKEVFEERNKIVHGRNYANFDRPDTLKSSRPNTPDRVVEPAELYELANHFNDLQGEIYRPMIFKIPRALTNHGKPNAASEPE